VGQRFFTMCIRLRRQSGRSLVTTRSAESRRTFSTHTVLITENPSGQMPAGGEARVPAEDVSGALSLRQAAAGDPWLLGFFSSTALPGFSLSLSKIGSIRGALKRGLRRPENWPRSSALLG